MRSWGAISGRRLSRWRSKSAWLSVVITPWRAEIIFVFVGLEPTAVPWAKLGGGDEHMGSAVCSMRKDEAVDIEVSG